MLRLALRSDAVEERALRTVTEPSVHGRGTTTADAVIVYRSTCTGPHAPSSFYLLTRITAPTVGLREACESAPLEGRKRRSCGRLVFPRLRAERRLRTRTAPHNPVV